MIAHVLREPDRKMANRKGPCPPSWTPDRRQAPAGDGRRAHSIPHGQTGSEQPASPAATTNINKFGAPPEIPEELAGHGCALWGDDKVMAWRRTALAIDGIVFYEYYEVNDLPH